jgi:predicted SAM-dependent methyltransferase
LGRAKALIKKIIGWPPSPLWRAVFNIMFEIQVWLKTLRSKAAFSSLHAGEPLKLHLGCGGDLRPGWVNIDLLPIPNLNMRSTEVIFIAHDLRRGLPLPDDSCCYIYSSHFWEHLDDHEGLQLLKECYRCLQPGGVFRIVLPDFARAFEAYMRHDMEFFGVIPMQSINVETELLTIADYIQYFVFQYGEHKHFYDPEKIRKVLDFVGYHKIEESSFQPGIDIDTRLRRTYSFYMEAEK